MLAVGLVIQARFARGGGWARLNLAVGRAVEKDLKVENYMRI